MVTPSPDVTGCPVRQHRCVGSPFWVFHDCCISTSCACRAGVRSHCHWRRLTETWTRPQRLKFCCVSNIAFHCMRIVDASSAPHALSTHAARLWCIWEACLLLHKLGMHQVGCILSAYNVVSALHISMLISHNGFPPTGTPRSLGSICLQNRFTEVLCGA